MLARRIVAAHVFDHDAKQVINFACHAEDVDHRKRDVETLCGEA